MCWLEAPCPLLYHGLLLSRAQLEGVPYIFHSSVWQSLAIM